MAAAQLPKVPQNSSAEGKLQPKKSCTAVQLEVKLGVKFIESSMGKKKRGRPPLTKVKTRQAPVSHARHDDEDVCFICFDGGSLVLCDYRGCPKAYHPSCIKRDESFFRSKAKWCCGWHICSKCQRASYFMCYTCTYSLCKGCTKDADYLCVRGNKGFCGTCMQTIMLIEKIACPEREMVQVDFDDKTSWEYLFKVYWLYLKAKLSLTLDELKNASNPWTCDSLPRNKVPFQVASVTCPKVESSGQISPFLKCSLETDEDRRKRRQTKKETIPVLKDYSVVCNPGPCANLPAAQVNGSWATKELMEFVAHMKGGDMSMLSRFDVQALMLEYVKRNNLRDRHRKCQIVCDSRLKILFGRSRVGHFEMLQLLDSHFLSKDKSETFSSTTVTHYDDLDNHVESVERNDCQLDTCDIGEQKTSTKDGYEQSGSDASHRNINFRFLKRTLLQRILDDAGKLHDKIVGSIVRIRVPGDLCEDRYKLVQVVGTSRVGKVSIAGTKLTDVVLEILNVSKKERISADEISDANFSKGELGIFCRDIKSGLMKPLINNEIQEQVSTHHGLTVSNWTYSEMLQLDNVPDRASANGHVKEQEKHVEKVEIPSPSIDYQCSNPDGPGARVNSNMGEKGEALEDVGESFGCAEPSEAVSMNKKDASFSPHVPETKLPGNKTDVPSTPVNEANSDCLTHLEEGEIAESSCPNSPIVRSNPVCSEIQAEPTVATSPATQTAGRKLSAEEMETAKLWYYKDPSGKVQGPFPMSQLRSWSSNNLFPLDLKVWRTDEEESRSVLLTKVLSGDIQKDTFCVSSIMANVVGQSPKENLLEEQTPPKHSQLEGETCNPDINTASLAHPVDPKESTSGYCRGNNGDECPSSLRKNHNLNGNNNQQEDTARADSVASEITSKDDHGTELEEKYDTRGREPEFRDSHSRVSSDGNSPVPLQCQDLFDSNATLRDEPETCNGQLFETQLIQKLESNNNGRHHLEPNCSGEIISRDVSARSVVEANQESEPVNMDTQFFNEDKHTVSNVPVLDLGLSWGSDSSLVVKQAQMPEITCEWDGYFPPQMTHCSSEQAAIDPSNWEPNEYGESVSDLLAEVEAMESLGGMPSPTSKMSCGLELTLCSSTNSIDIIDSGYPPMVPDTEKNDAISSTAFHEPNGSSQIPSYPALADPFQVTHLPFHAILSDDPLGASHMQPGFVMTEPFRTAHGEVLDMRKTFNWQSPMTSDAHTLSTVTQSEGGSDAQSHTPPMDAHGWEAMRGNEDQNHCMAVSTKGRSCNATRAMDNVPGQQGNPENGLTGKTNYHNYFPDMDSGFCGDSSFGRDTQSRSKKPYDSLKKGSGGASRYNHQKGPRTCNFYES